MDKNAMMEKLARAAYEKGSFNGTWLYAENGAIVSKGAFGFRDAENILPMQEDTVFEMASITKMFTATAVMLLVREGKLGLDDEYAKYFSDYPYPDVTVRHLLTHTSGMPEDFNTANWVAPVLEKEYRIPANSEIIRFIRESGEALDCAPGDRFEYTDIGYCLLANLVEKLSGVPFEVFLQENVFRPSGMKDSGIFHTRRDGWPSDRFARNMVLEDGGYIPSDISERTRGYVVGSDGLNGCAYLYTTVFDMLAWDRALREEKVLTREEQLIMYTPMKLNSGEVYADEDGDGYGFGWGINKDKKHGLIVSHSGGMPGLETWFEHFVDENRTLVILNCRDFSDIRAFVRFWDGMQAIARGEEAEPVVSIEDIAKKDPDKSKWENFCGKYEHPEDTDFIIDEVFMQNGELWAKAILSGEDYDNQGEVSFRLYPIGENEFGRKRGMLKLKFGDGCLMFDDMTCKKM